MALPKIPVLIPVNVTLLEKRVFADEIKLKTLRWRLSWIFWVDSKCNIINVLIREEDFIHTHTCTCMHAHTHRQRTGRTKRNSKMLAWKFDVRQPQSKECQKPPEAGRYEEQSLSLSLWRKHSPANTFNSALCS